MLAVDDTKFAAADPTESNDGAAVGRSPVMFVCSPRPRVGKTLVARLLVDFFLADDRPVAAFDANPNDPVLSIYQQPHTVPATIADTHGQMALFDRLIVNDGTPKVIDVASDQFERLVGVLRELDFAAAAADRSIDAVLLFVAENHQKSAEAYRRLMTELPGTTLVPVHNEVAESYGAPRLPHPAVGVMPVHVPHLPPYLHGVVRKPGFSFAEHVKRSAERQTLLHKWIGQPFIGFRDLELRLSLAEFAPLFRLYA
jgi:hypothetical protein